MEGSDHDRVQHLASLSADELGASEEDVKINFVVPLLEALGHERLRFEHKGRDVLLREGLPAAASVVVETKRAGEPLDRHLDQLARYALAERCFLAVLTNGDEVRVYAPLWPGAATFGDTLVLAVPREALASPPEVFRLGKLLGAAALKSGDAARAVAEQQERLQTLRSQAQAIRESVRKRRVELDARLRGVEEQLAALRAEREALLEQSAALTREEAETLRAHYGAAGLKPPASLAPAPPAAARVEASATAADADVPEPWTDDDLLGKAADHQRRILGAFASAGVRRLTLRQLTEAVGLGPQQTWGALSAFTMPVKKGSKEPFLEITKHSGRRGRPGGAAVETREKYWDAVLRLYGGGGKK